VLLEVVEGFDLLALFVLHDPQVECGVGQTAVLLPICADSEQFEQVVLGLVILAHELQAEGQSGLDFAGQLDQGHVFNQTFALAQLLHSFGVLVEFLLGRSDAVADVAFELVVAQLDAHVLGFVQRLDALLCDLPVDLGHVFVESAQFGRDFLLVQCVLLRVSRYFVGLLQLGLGFLQLLQFVVHVSNLDQGSQYLFALVVLHGEFVRDQTVFQTHLGVALLLELLRNRNVAFNRQVGLTFDLHFYQLERSPQVFEKLHVFGLLRAQHLNFAAAVALEYFGVPEVFVVAEFEHFVVGVNEALHEQI